MPFFIIKILETGPKGAAPYLWIYLGDLYYHHLTVILAQTKFDSGLDMSIILTKMKIKVS